MTTIVRVQAVHVSHGKEAVLQVVNNVDRVLIPGESVDVTVWDGGQEVTIIERDIVVPT